MKTIFNTAETAQIQALVGRVKLGLGGLRKAQKVVEEREQKRGDYQKQLAELRAGLASDHEERIVALVTKERQAQLAENELNQARHAEAEEEASLRKLVVSVSREAGGICHPVSRRVSEQVCKKLEEFFPLQSPVIVRGVAVSASELAEQSHQVKAVEQSVAILTCWANHGWDGDPEEASEAFVRDAVQLLALEI